MMPTYSRQLAFEPLSQQERYASTELRKLIQYLTTHSPFYQERFQNNQTPSDQILNLADLHKLPFTSKNDIQERNWDFLCIPRHSIAEYTTTSGTLGRPVNIALSESDLQRLAYNESQSFRCAGGQAPDIYQLALTLDRQFMAGMAYYAGIRKLGAAVIRTGPGLSQMQWDTIHKLGTTCLVGVPSFLLNMAKWAREQGIDPSKSPVKRAICIGESIRKEDLSLNALGSQLREAWPLEYYSTYAATELQTAFTECAAGVGGHVQPDLAIVEILDEQGQPVPDGCAGEVVITTLGIEAMPLLRYRTGDIATLHSAPCSCGRNSKRLGPIIGRKGQMIKYRGTTLFPPAIFDLLNQFPGVTSYVVELSSGSYETDEILLHLFCPDDPETCERSLKELFQSRLRVIPQMVFHSQSEIEAMIQVPGSRKPVRFIDRRN